MTNSHNYSFFGQKSALFVKSSSKKEPYIFFQCIKSKTDGSWEKPSQGEGKVIKISLEEMIMILQVLEMKQYTWSTYHSFKKNNTQININWDNDKERVWFNIGEYRKSLDIAQIEVFKMLLKHIVKEKVEYATSRDFDKNQYNHDNNHLESKTLPKKSLSGSKNSIKTILKEEVIHKRSASRKNSEDDIVSIDGKLRRETAKAFLIQLPNKNEIWIPKSKLHNEITTEIDQSQTFLIEKWILEKNKIAT